MKKNIFLLIFLTVLLFVVFQFIYVAYAQKLMNIEMETDPKMICSTIEKIIHQKTTYNENKKIYKTGFDRTHLNIIANEVRHSASLGVGVRVAFMIDGTNAITVNTRTTFAGRASIAIVDCDFAILESEGYHALNLAKGIKEALDMDIQQK